MHVNSFFILLVCKFVDVNAVIVVCAVVIRFSKNFIEIINKQANIKNCFQNYSLSYLLLIHLIILAVKTNSILMRSYLKNDSNLCIFTVKEIMSNQAINNLY